MPWRAGWSACSGSGVDPRIAGSHPSSQPVGRVIQPGRLGRATRPLGPLVRRRHRALVAAVPGWPRVRHRRLRRMRGFRLQRSVLVLYRVGAAGLPDIGRFPDMGTRAVADHAAISPQGTRRRFRTIERASAVNHEQPCRAQNTIATGSCTEPGHGLQSPDDRSREHCRAARARPPTRGVLPSVRPMVADRPVTHDWRRARRAEVAGARHLS